MCPEYSHYGLYLWNFLPSHRLVLKSLVPQLVVYLEIVKPLEHDAKLEDINYQGWVFKIMS